MSEQNKPENIIVYLDLMAEIITRKELNKAIENFLKEKLKKNPQTVFSLFYFTETNDPFNSEESSDLKAFLKVLEQNWKQRTKKESFFENGLFYCVSTLAAKAIKKDANYRVVVISDIPSNKNAEYVQALMNLVETVRTFPTFIDIIRVGRQRLYKDDVKLRIISTISSGGLFYCENGKDLFTTLNGLAKNKALPDLLPEGGQAIDRDKIEYYNNLSHPLDPLQNNQVPLCRLCNSLQCNFCGSTEDLPKKCSNCGTQYHECCGALYSWKQNIGVKHIFRCITCGMLIKLNEDTVYKINGASLDEVEAKEEDLANNPEDQEVWSPPTEDPPTVIVNPETQDQANASQQSTPNSNDGKFKGNPQGMGFFGPKPVPKKSLQKVEDQTSTEPSIQEVVESNTSPIKIKPDGSSSNETETLRERRKRLRTGVLVCPVCSSFVKPDQSRCPKCNSILKS